jgi:hypothetical protein
MSRPEIEPEEAEPKLVARVTLATPAPRVNGGPPQLNNITQADINRLNADRSIENEVMNAPGGWGAQPSEKNRTGQVSGFAGINADLTFSQYGEQRFGNSAFMRSRKVGRDDRAR